MSKADGGPRMVIRHLDDVLPALKLNAPTFIKIEVEDGRVRLWVGPRDWEWENGSLIGAGTLVGSGSDAMLREREAEHD